VGCKNHKNPTHYVTFSRISIDSRNLRRTFQPDCSISKKGGPVQVLPGREAGPRIKGIDSKNCRMNAYPKEFTRAISRLRNKQRQQYVCQIQICSQLDVSDDLNYLKKSELDASSSK
jgi:hypothetical protein